MAYTVRRTRSYGSRVKDSFNGILFGFVLFIGATILLWWNEGRAVKTDKMLNEAEKVCVDVEDVSKLDSELEGQMIHATADALTSDTLRFSDFGVNVNAIALSKSPMYYQWVEHKHEERHDKVGGSEEIVTTYTYSKEWVNSPTNSGMFEDPSYHGIFNKPVLMTDRETVYAEDVRFGAYRLPSNMIENIPGKTPVEPAPTAEQITSWNKSVKAFRRENKLTVYEDTSVSYIHIQGNEIYFGYNPNAPEVGDVKVAFEQVDQGTISILATVNGDTFKKYKAKNKYSFVSVERGEVSQEQMFKHEHEANTSLTWFLRVLGVLAIIAGLKMIFEILTTLLKVLPFLASIMSFGTGLICTIVGVIWSLLVIALAWLFYRPIVGILLLVLVGAIIWFFNKKAKKNAPSTDVPAA